MSAGALSGKTCLVTGAQNGALARLLVASLRPFLRTPEDGASTTIYLAASPEVAGVTGGYFIDCRPARSSQESCDPVIARRLGTGARR